MIKAIFIDIDDTLLSFSGYVKQAMKDGFRKFGFKEYDETMYQTFNEVNSGLWRQIEDGSLTFSELKKIRWNMVFKELDIDFDGEKFEEYFREELSHSAIVEPGAYKMLEYLSKKYVLCAASNGPHDQQINRLRIGKLYDFFDYYFISESVGAQKPSREFFDYCIKKLREDGMDGLLPEEIMIIGDSVSADMLGGKQYGIKTCLYNVNNKYSVKGEEADYMVNSLLDTMNIL
ncbi:MAG: YjjG family noncanonical pyrimidine nucleotidase [Lachnospiraceae bacterium]|nr:YjjG family noncanonical pyrimidine nucleotidase [Lachnospiraceae bacterium]